MRVQLLTASMRRARRYSGALATIQVKHVPEETHRVLTRRAAAAGQSLQEYLRTSLIEQASHPTPREVLDRISRRAPVDVTLPEVVQALHDGRAG